MLETDELLRPEEEGSRKWRLKSLILEGEMSSATNLGRRFGPRSVFWRSLGHGVLLCINDSLQVFPSIGTPCVVLPSTIVLRSWLASRAKDARG